MSKQSKDQQPQSASSSGDKQTSDGQAKPTGQEPNAAASGSPSADSRSPSSSAASSPQSNATKAQPAKGESNQPEPAKAEPPRTDPVKPDVAKPVGADGTTGKATGSSAAKEGSKSPSSGAAGAAAASASRKNDKSGKTSSTDTGTPSTGARTPSAGGGQPPAGGGSPVGGGNRGNGGKLGVLALILVILLAIAVAIVGYWGWQKLQQQQTQLSQIGTNSTTLDQLESRVGELDQNRQQNLNMMRGEFDQYRQNLDNTLDKVLKELAQQQQADPREWLHAEAEYLLRLANQRLQLERDVKGAKALLNAADDRLREADNPALVPIRRAIQSELASLDSVPVIDRTGLYLALMAQQEQLARLPLKQDIEEIAAGEGDTKPTGGWRQQLATLGSELKDLVTVRRHDQPLEALITPQQESYLRQNVRLLLEQAQLALLKSEPKLYQASLDKAIELVEGYYATDNDGVTNSIDKLKSLRGNEVRPELPDISESSQLLKRFIEQRFGNGSDSQDGSGSQNGGAQGGTSGSAQGEGA